MQPQRERRLTPEPSQRNKPTDGLRRAKNIRVKTGAEKPAKNEVSDKRQQKQPPKADYQPVVLRAQKTQIPKETRYQRSNTSKVSNRHRQTAFNPTAQSYKRPVRKPHQGHQVRARQDATSSGWQGRSSGPGAYHRQGSRQRR